MLRTKKDVDRHVQDIFRKLQDENERTLRCYKIAELYYHVGDYESARRYLSRYVEARKETKAHKLMGQILEALGQKEAALVQYKFAFELDGRQEDLVLKVCELLADQDVGIDVNRARYWSERADKLFPRHKVVFQLKEKILSIERPTNSEEDLERLIKSELVARPNDVHLRVKLLKHYMEKNKLDDAYKHATEIEATNLHRDSMLWYQALCELFLKCKTSRQLNWNFWITYISSLERYAALALKEQGSTLKKTSDAIQAVYNFDQHLFEAKGQSFSSYPSLTESIFLHMWGQLHFHMACLLLQNTQREQSSWSEAGRLCAPLLLTAMHVKPIDLTATWAVHVDNSLKNQLQIWYREGSYRCSQAGHVLHDYARGNQKKLISNIEKFCSGSWRERIYQRIFVAKIYQKIRSSYFTNNNAMNPPLRLISHNELKRFDEAAEEVWPYSLHHQIWPGIKSKNNSNSNHSSRHDGPLPNLTSHLFPELQFSVYNLNQASPVTLSRLDIDAFLNVAVMCSAAVVEEQQRNNLLNPDRLPTLPADLMTPLCSDDQEKWWSAAYKMYGKELIDDISETRQNIQRGLEVVRCIGNHGLHPTLLVHLARIFQHRAKALKEKHNESSDIPALESRAELYWSAAIPLLERLLNNQTIRSPHMKLFDYIGKEMNNMELTHAIEEGKLLLAQKLVRDKLYEQAIEALQALKCPEASFEQGKIYKKLADETMNNLPKENVTSEMRSQHIIVLSKARNCFYLTLDRLRSPDADPRHPLNAELCTHITAIENELKRIDPDTLYPDRNRNDCDDVSEESYSSAQSDEHPIVTNNLPVMNNSMQTPLRNARRTPRQASTPRHNNDILEISRSRLQDLLEVSRNRNEARPSPERLDAQIRQLVHSVESLKEQNREQHRAMISKLDELIRISARKESQPQKPNPVQQNLNQNYEDELYAAFNEEDYSGQLYRDFANYSNTSLPTPVGARAPNLAQNLFAATQRHPYSPIVYPSPAATAAVLNYYQSSPMAFADPATAAAAAAAAAAGQHMPGLYPGAAAAYPALSSLYRSGLEQPLAAMQQQTAKLREGLYGDRMSGQLPDYSQSQNQHIGIQQQLLGPQIAQLQMNEPPKSDAMGLHPPSHPTSEPNLPEPASITKDTTASSTTPASRKVPPVNVVITTSDTLPTTAPAVQPMLSVTIPAHHRLGGTGTGTGTLQDQITGVPHSYQISMPSQPTIPTTVNLPPLSATLTTTSSMMKSNLTSTDNQNSSIVSTGSRYSDAAEVEHDPIPDFAPIIPLPDEVPVTTGEENEEELFCARAKLFRFVEKEWKERGIGNVKLLKNPEGKIRLLMRREQVLKICANHMLRKDMELTMMPNNEKAYMWVANDFADEELRIEKLCIRFKTAEEAASFKEAFDKAKNSVSDDPKPIVTKTSANTEKPAAKPAAAKPEPVAQIGGFSFSSSPIIQKPPSAEPPAAVAQKKPEEVAAKPSPFAAFSFVKTTDAAAKAKPAVVAPTFGFSSPATAPTQTSGTGFSFGTPANTPVTPTQAPVFGQDPSKLALRRPHAPAPVDAANEVEKIDRVEDGETVLAAQNVKLMHFTTDSRDWKDKGNGTIKVLLEKATGRIRLLMNKEDDTKTLYSQVILPTVVFNLKADSVNWTFAVDKSKSESYFARFLDHNKAAIFHNTLTAQLQKSSKPALKPAPKSLSEMEKFKPSAGTWECKDCYTRNDPSNAVCVSCTAPAPVITAPAKTPQSVSKNLFQQFKPPTGSWECKDCYTRNNPGVTNCVACKAAAPGSTAGQPVATSTPAATPGSTPAKPLSEMFKPPAGSWECKQCYVTNTQSNVYCATCDTPKDPSMPPKPKTTGGFLINSQTPDAKTTFTFGMPQSQPATAKEAPTTAFNFNLASKPSEKAVSAPITIFGSNKPSTPNTSGFMFGSQPPKTPPPNENGPFTFGSPGKSFDFQFQAKSPPVKSPERHETSDEEVVEEAEDVYFAPIVPLPDKIDVKTGEENEEVLYSHRAKLFKFDTATKEWKERGLGDIKLLRHTNTKKLRLVMRREQVLKLCLNHAVTSALEIAAKDDKTWMWSAGDYSEGEIEYIQFACRFKTSEIAEDFKKSIDDACNGVTPKSSSTGPASKLSTAPGTAATTQSTKKDSSPDIQVVYEVKVTSEEKEAARKLLLPENFYAYKYKDDCPGCRGCRDSDVSLFASKTKEQAKPSGPIIVKANEITSTTPQSIFSFGASQPPSTTGLAKMTFGTSTPPVFGSSKTTFENGTASKPTFVFGGSSQPSAKPDSNDTGLENLKICEPISKSQQPPSTAAAPASTTSAPTNIFGGFGASTTSSSAKPVGGALFAGNVFSTPSFGTPGTTTASTTPVQNIFSAGKSGFGESKPLFSEPKLNSGGIFGGGVSSTTTNMFGGTSAPATTTTNIFGSSAPTTNVFGTTTTATAVTTNSFGSVASTTTTASTFGSITSTTTPGNVFGSSAPGAPTTTTPSTTGNVFGAAPILGAKPAGTGNTSSIFSTNTMSPSIFGGQTTITPTFGTLAAQSPTPATQTSVFGTTTFGIAATTPNTTATIPATTTASSGSLFSSTVPFGNSTSTPAANIFGNAISQQPSFGATKSAAKEEAEKKDSGVNFLPTDNSMSFSTLASQTSPAQQPAFKTDPNFAFEGAGASVFGAKASQKKTPSKSPHIKKEKENAKKDDDDEDGDEGDENGDEHDPYFEPIIPLPDAIEVRTGEEDEEKVFCQRAKLYRYDPNTKEWKERGVGEMKLLHHAADNRYRLLLRREQVHKVVCNLRLTADLEFNTLKTSDRAWVWAGMNYAEPENPEVEQLAVKFKSPELAAEFKEAVDKAQKALAEKPNQDTSLQHQQNFQDSPEDDEEDEEEHEEEHEDYDDDYVEQDEYLDDENEEEDDDMKMFEKRATLFAHAEGEPMWNHLAMGNLKVIYDSEMFGARIVFENDNNDLISDTVISMDTSMQRTEKECTWAAIDYALSPPVRRTLRAVFSSTQTSEEMYSTFQEGHECATKADIRE